MIGGYSLPLSPAGKASLVPAPPWHYVGDFLVIEYWADPAAVAAALPPGLVPYPDDPGRAAALFVDWQSCSDSGEELLDPIRGQYKEFFIVVSAMLGDELVTTCPYIWVDRDFALVRGWIQGFPKKLAVDSDDAELRARLQGRGPHLCRYRAGGRPPDCRGHGNARACSPNLARRTTIHR